MEKTNIKIKSIYCSYCKTSQTVKLGMLANLPSCYYRPFISLKLITTQDEITRKKAENLVENLKDNIEKIQNPSCIHFFYDLAKVFLILRKYEGARKIKKELYNTYRIFDFIEDEIRYGERISEIENDLEKVGKLIKDKPSLELSDFIRIFLLYSKLENKEKMKEYEFTILSKIKCEDTYKGVISLEEYLKEIPFCLFKKIYSELDKSINDEFLSLKDIGDESLYCLDKNNFEKLILRKIKRRKRIQAMP